MRLNHGVHLAYCTNIHRGENWAETFASLRLHTLAVKERVAPNEPYAIGLRLSDPASRELIQPQALAAFRAWLERNDCYVFTINGFPYGRFHGGRVKEQVYRPDWTTPERLAYTNRLFDILAQLLPGGMEGSVSTLPGSFKEFIHGDDQLGAIRDHLWQCVEHISRLCERTGHKLHLGVEPEPLGLFETSEETARFWERLRDGRNGDPRLGEHLGVNYDTCHLAVEFEEPADAIARFQAHGIKISKLHLSSALKLRPTPRALEALRRFADDVYLHQVIARSAGGVLTRWKDLDLALDCPLERQPPESEWRVHFHVPLHCPASELFGTTSDHLLGTLDLLKKRPGLCSHLEMETYTWEVLPEELKNRTVVDQLAGEYDWCLRELAQRGF
jgi:hypothetical protein